jgi:hypothetical protein
VAIAPGNVAAALPTTAVGAPDSPTTTDVFISALQLFLTAECDTAVVDSAVHVVLSRVRDTTTTAAAAAAAVLRNLFIHALLATFDMAPTTRGLAFDRCAIDVTFRDVALPNTEKLYVGVGNLRRDVSFPASSSSTVINVSQSRVNISLFASSSASDGNNPLALAARDIVFVLQLRARLHELHHRAHRRALRHSRRW